MGFWELVVVMIVGLLVLGPERMPKAIKTVSQWYRQVKQFGQSMTAELNEELRVKELHENLAKAEQQAMTNLTPELEESVSELKEAARSVTHSYAPNSNTANHDDSKKPTSK